MQQESPLSPSAVHNVNLAICHIGVAKGGHFRTGASKEKLGEAACAAVKRIHLDERMARAAAREGATLLEGFEVSGELVTFDKASGLWTVTSKAVRDAAPFLTMHGLQRCTAP